MKWWVVAVVLGWSVALHALPETIKKQATITELTTPGLNQIALLNNRFRIDHEIDEITLLFFREAGAPPSILVRPDGSKIYISTADGDTVTWFDDVSYDLIHLKNPMPGPWQVVGKIKENSRIIVLSEIQLHVDELPPLMIAGEQIKVTGRLSNGGQEISVPEFRDVIYLDVDFVSTNNKEFLNFGADTVRVAEFKDDGKGYDERPGDGVFTGEFILNFAAGQWIPTFHVSTPLLKRTLQQAPVIIEENPFAIIKMQTEADELAKQPQAVAVLGSETEQESESVQADLPTFMVSFNIKGNSIDTEHTYYQGTIYYPDKEMETFSQPAAGLQTSLSLRNASYGTYRIEAKAFSRNINGRDIVMDIPQFYFVIDPPPPPIVEKPLVEDVVVPEEPLAPPPPKRMSAMAISLIVFANVVLLLLGLVAVRVFVMKKPLWPKKQLQPEAEPVAVSAPTQSPATTPKPAKTDDILDLSMPD